MSHLLGRNGAVQHCGMDSAAAYVADDADVVALSWPGAGSYYYLNSNNAASRLTGATQMTKLLRHTNFQRATVRGTKTRGWSSSAVGSGHGAAVAASARYEQPNGSFIQRA